MIQYHSERKILKKLQKLHNFETLKEVAIGVSLTILLT